jgi:hypothetical protein
LVITGGTRSYGHARDTLGIVGCDIIVADVIAGAPTGSEQAPVPPCEPAVFGG